MTKDYGPDILSNVYAFYSTEESAQEQADYLNRNHVTQSGKRFFESESFRVEHIPGRLPAVVGNRVDQPKKKKTEKSNPSPHIRN